MSKFEDQNNHLPGKIRGGFSKKVTMTKVGELRQELWKQERNEIELKDNGSKK